eukprot:TRINITY_DN19_c0_g1_i10.p2 TRINITY_DN19_c0_g1~~TRINITY_DN19_c0_g1_i10.p2  ORF type:complete len:306 (-),score=-93.46 TRINITY_DN19_c0_g1_i10:2340-3257(-)
MYFNKIKLYGRNYYMWRLTRPGLLGDYYGNDVIYSRYLSEYLTYAVRKSATVDSVLPTAAPLVEPRGVSDMVSEFNKPRDTELYPISLFMQQLFTEKRILSKAHHNYLANRATFINKFTRHGFKARSQKGFAVALAKVHALYFNKLRPSDLIQRKPTSIYGTLHDTGISLENMPRVMLYTYFKYLKHITKFGLFLTDTYSCENTAMVYNTMVNCAPSRALIVQRVSKQVYKNTRGKSGRYTTKIVQLPTTRIYNYMLTYYKYTCRFSLSNTFEGRYFDVLYAIVVEPKAALGYIYRHRGSTTINE